MADTKHKKTGIKVDPTLDDRYERSDARHSAVVLWVIVLTAGAILSAASVYYYYKYAVARIEQRAAEGARESLGPRSTLSPETPQLQIAPQVDLAAFREAEKETLNSYGWVSKEAGVARIPIRRGMELVLQRYGTNSAQDVPTTGTAPDTGGDLPQDSSGGRTSWNIQR